MHLVSNCANLSSWSVAVLLLLLCACNRETGVPQTTPSTAAMPGDERALVFAVHPYDNPSRLSEQFGPLCRYLGERIGRPVRLYIAHSYGDQIRRIANGEVDLAYMGPTPYLRARDHYLAGKRPNIEIVAGERMDGKPNYYSVLVVRADSPIDEPEDLVGHTLAFGSPRSFGSHYVPRTILLRAGVQLKDLKDYEYLGRHERVALAVLHGDFDAGGLRKDIVDQYLHRGLKVIAESFPLPPHVIVARPGLDPDLVAGLRQALLVPGAEATEAFRALHPAQRTTGFAAVAADAYHRAREIVEMLETTVPMRPEQLP